jgi:heme/copper-type cytochrome/quinol oxidase subunit 1
VYTLVRRFIKTGAVFLVLGLLLGAWILVSRELLGRGVHPHLVSAHAHALLSGFGLFLIFGVALWLFPRAPKGDTRYTPGRAAAAYWILLVGTAGRVGSEIARSVWTLDWLPWVIVLTGMAQVAGVMVYLWTMWPRIRPVGSHLREAKGERF